MLRSGVSPFVLWSKNFNIYYALAAQSGMPVSECDLPRSALGRCDVSVCQNLWIVIITGSRKPRFRGYHSSYRLHYPADVFQVQRVLSEAHYKWEQDERST